MQQVAEIHGPYIDFGSMENIPFSRDGIGTWEIFKLSGSYKTF